MPSLLQIAQELTLCLAADVTPLLLGERGIGKSSIVRELAYDEAPEFTSLRKELSCSEKEKFTRSRRRRARWGHPGFSRHRTWLPIQSGCVFLEGLCPQFPR